MTGIDALCIVSLVKGFHGDHHRLASKSGRNRLEEEKRNTAGESEASSAFSPLGAILEKGATINTQRSRPVAGRDLEAATPCRF